MGKGLLGYFKIKIVRRKESKIHKANELYKKELIESINNRYGWYHHFDYVWDFEKYSDEKRIKDEIKIGYRNEYGKFSYFNLNGFKCKGIDRHFEK